MKVKAFFKHPDLKPRYASIGAACFDFRANIESPVEMWQGSILECGTGIHMQIPVGYCMLIFGRSGLAFKNGIRLANSVAVIDSDYRGEIRIKLIRDYGVIAEAPIVIQPMDRIAQGMIIPIPLVDFCSVQSIDELDGTERGTGGLGSTGLGAL